MKAGATTPEASSVQDTAASSDMEESVVVPVQASQDAKTALDPLDSNTKNLDETDQNDHEPLLTQGNEESSSEQAPPFVFRGGEKAQPILVKRGRHSTQGVQQLTPTNCDRSVRPRLQTARPEPCCFCGTQATCNNSKCPCTLGGRQCTKTCGPVARNQCCNQPWKGAQPHCYRADVRAADPYLQRFQLLS